MYNNNKHGKYIRCRDWLHFLFFYNRLSHVVHTNTSNNLVVCLFSIVIFIYIYIQNDWQNNDKKWFIYVIKSLVILFRIEQFPFYYIVNVEWKKNWGGKRRKERSTHHHDALWPSTFFTTYHYYKHYYHWTLNYLKNLHHLFFTRCVCIIHQMIDVTHTHTQTIKKK